MEFNSNESDILKFYYGKSIFITGATGFLGKVLVEKLLRTCDVNKIYLLLRTKKGQSASQRLASLTTKLPFTFHEKTKQNIGKLVAVDGNISLQNLGLSAQNKQTIIDTVSIVIHSAADVAFDNDFSSKIYANVEGIKNVLDLCHQIKNLECLIHVSTAYSFCNRRIIDEKIYPLSFTLEEFKDVVNLPESNQRTQTLIKFLEKRPNFYCLTKAMGEHVVQNNRGDMTVAIVRPSMITPGFEEPVEGWIDTIQGLSGIGLAAQVGLLQTVDWNYYAKADTFPVDFCTNSIISAAWYISNNNKNKLTIYNLTSGPFYPITWGEMFELCRVIALECPSTKQIRPLMKPPKYTKAPFYYPLQKFVYHILFALFLDMLLTLFGYKRFMYRLAVKLNLALDLVTFFTRHEFTFLVKNYMILLDSMSDVDKKLFLCDIRGYDVTEWKAEEPIKRFVSGTRRFLLHEKDSTIPRARIQVYFVTFVYRLFQVFLFWLIWRCILVPLFSMTVNIL